MMKIMFERVRKPRFKDYPPLMRYVIGEAWLHELFPNIVEEFNTVAKLYKWKERPSFEAAIDIQSNPLKFAVGYDKDTEGGKHFMWVDEGTGLEGPFKSKYLILPKNPDAGYKLVFDKPYQPLTFPQEPLRYDVGEEIHTVGTPYVEHPGIQARKFSVKVRKKYMEGRGKGTFYDITTNAYKRAFRMCTKMGIF